MAGDAPAPRAQAGRLGWGRRLLFGAVLAVGLSLCCGILGMFVAGRCCVPEGSGLAGPGIVVGYGLLAALLGMVAGGALSAWLPPRALGIGATLLGVAGGCVLLPLIITLVQSGRERDAALAAAYARLPAFQLAITAEGNASGFERFEADWALQQTLTIEQGRECRRSLAGKHAVRLLEALRGVEGVLIRSPAPCAGTPGTVSYRLQFRVPEALPPDTRGEIALTDACLQAQPAVAGLLERAREQANRAGKCLP